MVPKSAVSVLPFALEKFEHICIFKYVHLSILDSKVLKVSVNILQIPNSFLFPISEHTLHTMLDH